MAIPAVRRENAVAMLRGFSQQDTGERLPIDAARMTAWMDKGKAARE